MKVSSLSVIILLIIFLSIFCIFNTSSLAENTENKQLYINITSGEKFCCPCIIAVYDEPGGEGNIVKGATIEIYLDDKIASYTLEDSIDFYPPGIGDYTVFAYKEGYENASSTITLKAPWDCNKDDLNLTLLAVMIVGVVLIIFILYLRIKKK